MEFRGNMRFKPGKDQPPRKRVTIIADIAIIAQYSPRKNRENLILLYSVWNPPTSSGSDSGISNGRRLVSAKAVIKKMKKAMGCRKQSQLGIGVLRRNPCWLRTMELRLRVAVDIMTLMTASPIAISKLMI